LFRNRRGAIAYFELSGAGRLYGMFAARREYA
jgi:hypothetical protein